MLKVATPTRICLFILTIIEESMAFFWLKESKGLADEDRNALAVVLAVS